MKTLKEYLLEEKDDITASTSRGDIKFTIWKAPDKKVTWLKDNESYQKIEYKLEDKEESLYIDFLLGFKDGSWKTKISYFIMGFGNFSRKQWIKGLLFFIFDLIKDDTVRLLYRYLPVVHDYEPVLGVNREKCHGIGLMV